MAPSQVQFTDHTPPTTISLPSTWRKVKQKSDGVSQTEPMTMVDSAVQVLKKVDGHTQTDPHPPPKFHLLQPPDYNPTTLPTFLSQTEHPLSTLLLQNIKSTAFDGWTPQWETPVTDTTLAYTLEDPNREDGMVVTDLSWNKFGTTVAVAYGRLDHESWCVHRGVCGVWGLSGRNGVGKMGWGVEVESCIMTLSYHPTLPSLLAGGTFNGQIFIAQTNDPNNPIATSSKMSDQTHQEPVAKVEWVPGPKDGTWNVMSVGNDGKVLVWDVEGGLERGPVFGSQLTLGGIPRHLRPSTFAKPDTALGGTSLTYPPENPTIYLCATEAGYITKCSRSTALQFPSSTQTHNTLQQQPPKLPNPTQFTYKAHTGPVTALSCSPFHRNLFASAGSDGEVRVYNILQSKPLLTLSPTPHTLLTLSFSPTRATVFCTTSSQGLLYIYDLAHSPSLPHTTLQVTSGANVAATALAFGRGEFLATGDSGGVVKIWRVASGLREGCGAWEWGVVEGLGSLVEEGF